MPNPRCEHDMQVGDCGDCAAGDPVAAFLDDAQKRYQAFGETGAFPALLAAVEAVRKPHQRGPVVILGALCPRHENHRYFSITAVEAADVIACPECTATVRDSCAYCGPQVPLDACPVRKAISRELLGDTP